MVNMSDNTERKPDPNPDHDAHAAGMYRAIALRFYCRYVDARKQAAFCGEDIEGAEPLPTPADASDRYQSAVADWLTEPPSTSTAALSLVEFAAVIAVDKLVDAATRGYSPISDEKDALHQTLALAAVGDWLNREVVTRDWLDRRVAAYGPGGMPRKGGPA
jgi:hypothetical protein